MKKDQKIIVANWKMNPATRKEVLKLFSEIKKNVDKLQNTQTVICSPAIYLADLNDINKNSGVVLGAQDVFFEEKGSFTGMISAKMLKEFNVGYVILGHSERRSLGESDEMVNKKIKTALKNKLKVVLCIGEKERGENGEHFEFIKEQMTYSLNEIEPMQLKNILIAYEPVWAISGNNKGEVVSSEYIQQMVTFIKRVLTEKYGDKIKMSKMLYGGSVNIRNSKDILEEGGVNGLLVGKASLSSKEFGGILKIADSC